jgi:hypothetical protein
MAEQRVVVERDLGIERYDISRPGDDQGVDLDDRAVKRNERRVHARHELAERTRLSAREPESRGKAAAVETGDAGCGIDANTENFFGSPGGNFFDLHPARHGGDEGDPPSDPVHEQR